jgi:modified peptide precursor CbpA
MKNDNKKRKSIKVTSYRHSCIGKEKATGLSHYIMIDNKKKKQE